MGLHTAVLPPWSTPLQEGRKYGSKPESSQPRDHAEYEKRVPAREEGAMKKEAIFPADLPQPRVAYSPAVKAGPLVFVSGQVASDFKTGIPPQVSLNPNFPH